MLFRPVGREDAELMCVPSMANIASIPIDWEAPPKNLL